MAGPGLLAPGGAAGPETYRLISVDDHIDLQYLPHDLWTSRLPAALRDRGPQPRPAADGSLLWHCDGARWGRWAGGPPDTGTRSYQTALERAGHLDAAELRPTRPELRLADMDRDGIELTVMYGPVAALAVDDPALRLAVYAAYNDWLADLCRHDPDRLVGVALLPAEDPEGATAELERLAEAGAARQVSMHIARTAEPIWSPRWSRFWDLIQASGVIASFHLVLTPQMLTGMNEEAVRIFETSKGFINQFLDPLVGVLGHGTLERRPGARLVLAESGLGWLPWVVQEMDYRYRRLRSMGDYWDSRGGIGLQEPPSGTFRRQVWVTFQDDEAGLDQLHHFGPDKVMWACDYPHPDSTFPHSAEVVDRLTARFDPATRHRLLRGNAEQLYRP